MIHLSELAHRQSPQTEKPKRKRETDPVLIGLGTIRNYLEITTVPGLETDLISAKVVTNLRFDLVTRSSVPTITIEAQIPEAYRFDHQAVKTIFDFLVGDQQLRSLLFCNRFALLFRIVFKDIDPQSAIVLKPNIDDEDRADTWAWFKETWQEQQRGAIEQQYQQLYRLINELIAQPNYQHFEKVQRTIHTITSFDSHFLDQLWLSFLNDRIQPASQQLWESYLDYFDQNPTLETLEKKLVPFLWQLVAWGIKLDFKFAIDELFRQLKTHYPSLHQKLYHDQTYLHLKQNLLSLRQEY